MPEGRVTKESEAGLGQSARPPGQGGNGGGDRRRGQGVANGDNGDKRMTGVLLRARTPTTPRGLCLVTKESVIPLRFQATIPFHHLLDIRQLHYKSNKHLSLASALRDTHIVIVRGCEHEKTLFTLADPPSKAISLDTPLPLGTTLLPRPTDFGRCLVESEQKIRHSTHSEY